jgi:hypothetical protein
MDYTIDAGNGGLTPDVFTHVKRSFRFDAYNVARMEKGGIVWRGDTAYSVEWHDENKK